MRRNGERLGVLPEPPGWEERARSRGKNPLTRTATPPRRPALLLDPEPGPPTPGAEATAIRYPYGITDYQDLLNKINALAGGSEPFTSPIQLDAAVPESATTPLLLVGEDALVNGDADGTVIGSNQPDTFEGDFINFQIDGDSVFRVDFSGALFLDGPILMTLPAGFTGDLIDLQIDGSSVFRVDEAGDIYLNDVLFAPVQANAENDFSAQQDFTITDTVNTGPATPIRVAHRLSSGSAAAGFGVHIELNGEDDAGGAETFGIIVARATNTTDAALSTTIEFQPRTNGSIGAFLQLRGSPTLPGIACNEMLEAVGGLAVNNVQAASLGSLTAVFEVFDSVLQTSLGYVPIYDGFTPP